MVDGSFGEMIIKKQKLNFLSRFMVFVPFYLINRRRWRRQVRGKLNYVLNKPGKNYNQRIRDYRRRIDLFGGVNNDDDIIDNIKDSILSPDTKFYERPPEYDVDGRRSFSIRNKRLNTQILLGLNGKLISFFDYGGSRSAFPNFDTANNYDIEALKRVVRKL